MRRRLYESLRFVVGPEVEHERSSLTCKGALALSYEQSNYYGLARPPQTRIRGEESYVGEV
jgi:hypothetical protein